jgi:hypothetical protein
MLEFGKAWEGGHRSTPSCALIRRMSVGNPLWGAPRIHGELLKLGFELAQSSVAKYVVKRRGPPNQGWRTFLHNHAPDIAAMTCSLSDHRLQTALCLRHHSARPQSACLDQLSNKSDRGVNCTPDNGDLSMG